MYEELLPYWKERCHEITNVSPTSSQTGTDWVEELERKNLSWEWGKGESINGYYKDCIVQDIMLFTWEAGLD